ncbi:heavy metal translocating P-type ATPase [Parasalinivibrio latis]|uniref:cation transporter n=1 Tax=Parasalinivibrio latis TaxID=2952610 RepID=UPI0030E5262E
MAINVIEKASTVTTVPLSGLSCMGCARKVQQALEQLPGVTSLEVDTKEARIQGHFSLNDVIEIVDNLGYSAGNMLILPLAGLRCGKCVAKVKSALEARSDIAQAHVSKEQVSVTGIISEEVLINLIESLGYQVPTTQTYHLALSGLSCGKCVAKVESALASNSAVSAYSVSKNAAEVTTTLSEDNVIALITDLGYQASPATEDACPVPSPDVADVVDIHPANKKAGSNARQFILEGMTCASCVSSVEKAVLSVNGVTGASVNLAERTAIVSGEFDPDAVVKAVSDAGYKAELSEDEQTRREKLAENQAVAYRTHVRNAAVSLAIGIPLMAWGVLGGTMTVDTPVSRMAWGVVAVITFALLATAGKHFFVSAWKAFRHHRATMDTLVSLGTGAAWLYSTVLVIAPEWFPLQARHVYFEATAMILGLITLGHALEARARARTSKALDRLMDLRPQTAVVVENGVEREVPLSDVKAGMTLRLKPGSKVAVDGVVLEGTSYLDESMLTGEPLAAHKQPGDTVHAGTVNQSGSLLFQATRIGSDTMLSRIIQLVRQAQSSKPALAKLADRISAVFVPSVMIIAVLTALAWYNFGPDPKTMYMLVTATTVLIIACPCALGLATPMSVNIGVGRAAELGILVRNAEALQLGAEIDTVVLDKTGTLTEGKPRLTSVHVISGDEESLLTVAASLEQQSEHPLAKAVIEAVSEKGFKPLAVEGFHAVTGMGVSASLNDTPVALGNARMMEQSSVAVEKAGALIDTMASQGETPVYVARDGKLLGLLGISDPLRADSAEAVAALQKLGLDVVMLTGDIPATAQAIARKVGITQVVAGVLPDGKAKEVRRLQTRGHKVAMVGDGINDAPALAQAEVGIAMGSGSDVAIESAQFTLMRHSVSGVVDTLALSRATLRNMKENLLGAFVYNTLGIPVAAGILFPLTGSLLSPVVAGAAMALSSITVVSNANRLRLFRSPVNTEEK